MDLDLIGRIFGSIGVSMGMYARFTNPFLRWSQVGWQTEINCEKEQWQIVTFPKVTVGKGRIWKWMAMGKAGWHILAGVLSVPRPRKRLTHDEIILKIHKLRFGSKTPYLISGDHFSVLYPRSLGVFYASLLDSETALSKNDWEWRQLVYLKTTMLILETARKTSDLFTTIVPMGGDRVMPLQIYAYPSDTLYSLLYALKNMNTNQKIGEDNYILNTQKAADDLMKKYAITIKRHWEKYQEQVLDRSTGLVKGDIYLSGTKDMARRKSSFYDSVMLWSTGRLATELGFANESNYIWNQLKGKIINEYWDKERNWWREELNGESRYSSDWLIAVQVGMLSVDNKDELMILEKCVKTIEKMKLDVPLPLAYHKDLRLEQLHWPVRIGAKWYGSRAIWSHWGIEYIKLLLSLYKVTGQKNYLDKARYFLDGFGRKIVECQGYPEVLRPNGKLYRTGLYRSIINNGWVVNYQQARKMFEKFEKS